MTIFQPKSRSPNEMGRAPNEMGRVFYEKGCAPNGMGRAPRQMGRAFYEMGCASNEKWPAPFHKWSATNHKWRAPFRRFPTTFLSPRATQPSGSAASHSKPYQCSLHRSPLSANGQEGKKIRREARARRSMGAKEQGRFCSLLLDFR